MRHKRLISVGIAALVVILAAVSFAVFIPNTSAKTSRMARLVVTKPPTGFTAKPASASVVAPASSPFSIVQQASKQAPHYTGSYTVAWTRPGSTSDSATLHISLLPSADDASKAQAQALTDFLAPSSLQANQFTYVGPLSISSPPGAKGSEFTSSSTQGDYEVVVAYPFERTQVLEFVGMTAAAPTVENDARTLAVSEYDQLVRALPGFKLTTTTLPLVASVLFIVIAGMIALAIVVVPETMVLVRRRREQAQEEALRREMRVRGSKVVKRQRQRQAGRSR
jgi:hypothetical protein